MDEWLSDRACNIQYLWNGIRFNLKSANWLSDRACNIRYLWNRIRINLKSAELLNGWTAERLSDR